MAHDKELSKFCAHSMINYRLFRAYEGSFSRRSQPYGECQTLASEEQAKAWHSEKF